MAMEGVRSSIITAALLFLLTLVLAAAATSGGGDDNAAAAEAGQCQNPLAPDEPYALITFHHKDGEEVRVLADQRPGLVPGISGFANRSGNWFYSTTREGGNGNGKPRRRPLPLLSSGGSRTEGLWNTLGVLANTTGASKPAAADDDEHYVLIGLQTSGGDKIRLAAVVDDQQRYVHITGFAKGFFYSPEWFFREGAERHRILAALGDDGYAHGGSHAEVVAANLLTALMKEGRSCF